MSRAAPIGLLWATRGLTWGFRFLLNGGFDDPLPVYDEAFSSLGEEPRAWARVGDMVALRFPDPEGRQDRAGRAIPHEFVLLPPLSDQVGSVQDGLRVVWPLVAARYAAIWNSPRPQRSGAWGTSARR